CGRYVTWRPTTIPWSNGQLRNNAAQRWLALWLSFIRSLSRQIRPPACISLFPFGRTDLISAYVSDRTRAWPDIRSATVSRVLYPRDNQRISDLPAGAISDPCPHNRGRFLLQPRADCDGRRRIPDRLPGGYFGLLCKGCKRR